MAEPHLQKPFQNTAKALGALKLHEIPEQPEPEVEHASPGVTNILFVNSGQKAGANVVSDLRS